MALLRFVSITKNGSNPAYRGARCGMDRMARLRGIELTHFTPAVDDDIPQQAELVRALLRNKPDALLISAAHESALDEELQQLRDAGVPIVMFVGRTTRRDLARCFVGSNDRTMTRAVAETVARTVGGRGDVLVLDGNPLGILYEARSGGFRDGLARHPGMRLKGARDGHFLRQPAYEAMKALLDEHGAPDAVLVANDFMGLGAIDALHERGLRPALGSVNATPDGIEAIKRGDMTASAAFNAMAMGCLALEAAVRIHRGESVPDTMLLPAEVVTRDSTAPWELSYDERPLPDWETIASAQAEAVK